MWTTIFFLFNLKLHKIHEENGEKYTRTNMGISALQSLYIDELLLDLGIIFR